VASLVLLIPAGVIADQPNGHPVIAGAAQAGSSVPADGDCQECHYCDSPTQWNRCLLRTCTRGRTGGQQGGTGDDRGPEVIILDRLDGDYLPVPFDHAGHARMADMGDGCETCHHFTPEGKEQPRCGACHDSTANGTDIYKPGLKGAYHQQCMSCHRDWVDETDCSVCHMARANGKATVNMEGSVTRDDLVGRAHPPIPEPDTDFYGGEPADAAGPAVVFRHEEHVQRFGLTCVECHREPSCARCHSQDRKTQEASTREEHHRPCIKCHKADMNGASDDARCSRCHWENGAPLPARFDHARVGWPLSRYHRSLGCRECHAHVPFVRESKECGSCHSDWSPSTFNHRVTGQALDEIHVEHDCADCHLEGKFAVPPACTECHDAADDGIGFPARRPGPLAEPDNSPGAD
jgi:hypothetical protein